MNNIIMAQEYAERILEIERIFYEKENDIQNLNKPEQEKIIILLDDLKKQRVISEERKGQVLSCLFNSAYYFITQAEGLKKIVDYRFKNGKLTKSQAEEEMKSRLQELNEQYQNYKQLSQKHKQSLAFTQLYESLTPFFSEGGHESVPLEYLVGNGLEQILLANFDEITKNGIEIEKNSLISTNEVGKLVSFSCLKELTIVKRAPKKQNTKLKEEFYKAKLVYSAPNSVLTPKPLLYIDNQNDYDYLIFYKIPSCTAADFIKKVDQKLERTAGITSLTNKEFNEVKGLIKARYAEVISRAVAESVAKMQVQLGRFTEENYNNLLQFDFEFYYINKIKPHLNEIRLTQKQEKELFEGLRTDVSVLIHRDLHPNNVLFFKQNTLHDINGFKEKYWLTFASIIDFELLSKACSPIFDIVTLIESNYHFNLSDKQKRRILKYFAEKVRANGSNISDEEVERLYRPNAIFANLRLAALNSESLRNSKYACPQEYLEEKEKAIQTVKDLLENKKLDQDSEISILFEKCDKIYTTACDYAKKESQKFIESTNVDFEKMIEHPDIGYIEDCIIKSKNAVRLLLNLEQESINNQLKKYPQKNRNKLREILKLISYSSDKFGFLYNNGLFDDILPHSKKKVDLI